MNETYIATGNARIDALFPRIKGFLLNDITEYNMFGSMVRGYRTPDAPSIWIRDYSDMMRAFRYWEKDMRSIIDHFAEMQTRRGWLFDYFTMTPEKVPCEKENWAKYVRVPVEADVEYRFVKALWLAWQSTGDDVWMKSLLPAAEKALAYILTDPWRWDPKLKLVKRAYTIDTWDFDYTAGRHPWLNFQIDERTFWGIMHGDNSGYYEAFIIMSKLYSEVRNKKRAQEWMEFAEAFQRRANRVCWNGSFYTHFVKRTPVSIPGVDESAQLSLSNPMDINRGLATHHHAVSIIREYQKRAATSGAFAEWFSIDPPFPDGIFGDEKIVRGAYCNGGIMPLVGGELARAAFEHGFERYAVDQILKYDELTANNESYLWYFPNGKPATIETSTSPDASPTDAWGSSAFAYALIEGLAGIVDEQKLYRSVRLAPRWLSADIPHARVSAAYGASAAGFAYEYEHDEAKHTITLRLEGEATVSLHALLPEGSRAVRMIFRGKDLPFKNVKVQQSRYADAEFRLRGTGMLEIRYT
jgi:hypothetical protein